MRRLVGAAALLLAANHALAFPLAQWHQPLFSVGRQELTNVGFVLGASDGDIAVSETAYSSLLIDHRDPTSLGRLSSQRLNQAGTDDYGYAYGEWTPVVACPDGGQVVVERGGDGLAKLDAQGKVVARQRISTFGAAVAQLGADRILVASTIGSKLRLMAFSMADLSVAWIRNPPLPNEPSLTLTAVTARVSADGSVGYAILHYGTYSGSADTVENIVQIAGSDGSVRWSLRVAGDATHPNIYADAVADDAYFVSLGNVYGGVDNPGQVRRYSAADGTPGWQVDGSCPASALATSSTRLVAAGDCGTQLLDKANGQTVWTNPANLFSPQSATVLATGDVLLAGRTSTASNPTNYNGNAVRRLTAANGSTSWQWNHPDGGSYQANGLRVSGSSVYVLSWHTPTDAYYGQLELFRLDDASGTQLGRAHLDDVSPVYGGSRVVDAGHVLQYGSSEGLERNEFVVQKLAIADGTPDWTVALSEDYSVLNAQDVRYTALSPDGALGVFVAYPASGAGIYGEALELAEIEVASGARRWRKRFYAGSTFYMSANGLAYDLAGNPAIAYRNFPQPNTFGFASQELVKFGRLDGSTLWSVDLGTSASIDAIAALGDDLVVQSRTSSGGASVGRVERRSGKDGSVVWSHDFVPTYFSNAQTVVAANGDVLVATPVPDTQFLGRGATLRIERLAGASGALLWAKTFKAPQNTSINTGWLHVGVDGGLYSGFAARNTINTKNAIVTQRLDPATGDLLWRDERDYRSARGVTYSYNPGLGADGVLRVLGSFDGNATAYDLEFQGSDGNYLGARKQSACQVNLPLVDDDCGSFSRRDSLADGSTYVAGVFGEVSASSTQTALRTIPALPLHGELELHAAAAPTATPFSGAYRRDFSATVTYRGGVSTHPFALRLLGTNGGSVDHWSCSAAGASTCGSAQGQGEPVLPVGLADGDTVTISGQILQDDPAAIWQPTFTVDAPYDIALGCMANDNLQSACLYPIFDDSFE